MSFRRALPILPPASTGLPAVIVPGEPQWAAVGRFALAAFGRK